MEKETRSAIERATQRARLTYSDFAKLAEASDGGEGVSILKGIFGQFDTVALVAKLAPRQQSRCRNGREGCP